MSGQQADFNLVQSTQTEDNLKREIKLVQWNKIHYLARDLLEDFEDAEVFVPAVSGVGWLSVFVGIDPSDSGSFRFSDFSAVASTEEWLLARKEKYAVNYSPKCAESKQLHIEID